MMRLGKLDNDDLNRLVLSKFHATRPESASSPAIGQDCAALDLSGDLVILSCDPITSAGIAHLGRLSVHICCNDAAAAGAEPVALLVTLLMPPSGSFDDIDRIANDLASAAKAANVDIVGGHTEVTDAVARPVTITSVIARRQRDSVLGGMRAGNALVLTKWAGLEGTTILAEDYAARLTALPQSLLAEARSLSAHLSVVKESRVAMRFGATSMHDVTEGGVLGAAWEMAFQNGCGVQIDSSRIPVLSATKEICSILRLDPLRLIGSGSMLIACKDGETLVSALQDAGVSAAIIGYAANAESTVDGAPLAEPHADELYRLFESEQ